MELQITKLDLPDCRGRACPCPFPEWGDGMTEMGNLCCPLIFLFQKKKKSFEGGRRRAEGGNLKVEGRR